MRGFYDFKVRRSVPLTLQNIANAINRDVLIRTRRAQGDSSFFSRQSGLQLFTRNRYGVTRKTNKGRNSFTKVYLSRVGSRIGDILQTTKDHQLERRILYLAVNAVER